MSPAQPQGAALPGGHLPAEAVGAQRPFAVYVHVPYCRVRCGYCDFNTYTNLDMGGGASARDYVSTLEGELRVAQDEMTRLGISPRPARTVFFGGGTPTMLPAEDLARALAAVRETWGIASDAEITTEANPETVDETYLAKLAEAGFTRISVGMQSAVTHVLTTLDRTHRPERVPQVIRWAKAAGLDTSVDLIYGTPGESLEDWAASLQAAVRMEPDHISAYALVIEEGTRMHTQVRRGQLPMPTDDDEATKYEMADAALAAAGYSWYEISNWARPGHECRHNLAYWRDWDWYGAGPGAHSHLGRVRWWNTKAPVAWAAQIGAGKLPAAGHEIVDEASRELEHVMLGIRLREGLRTATLCRGAEPTTSAGTPRRLVPIIAGLVSQGYLEPTQAIAGRLILTLRGRLMADTVTAALTD